jgi:hypothetical protein
MLDPELEPLFVITAPAPGNILTTDPSAPVPQQSLVPRLF